MKPEPQQPAQPQRPPMDEHKGEKNAFGGGNQNNTAMPQLQLSGTNDLFGGPSKTTVNNNDQDFFN